MAFMGITGSGINIITMTSPHDVLIIGGGPAGSTAATLLSMQGHRVLVVEKEQFPRFHIGESMLPNSMGTFLRLGVKEKLDRICLPKTGVEFATCCGHSQQFQFKNAYRAIHPQAYQVERAVFDKVLLDHARESGAEVLEETAVEKFEETGETIRVSLRSKDSDQVVETKYLLDCSGRNSVIANHFGLKQDYPK
jgi:flavin-dependent dehydrogenase